MSGTTAYRDRARGRSRGRQPRAFEMYWPTGKVDCPLTPAQAWELHVHGNLSHEGFQMVLEAWR